MIKGLWKFYLRRYYRITIPLILVMFFCVGLNRFVHNGPYHSGFYEWSATNCPKYIYLNFLYINNFNIKCFGHAWYLGNDMQFYWYNK